SDSIQRPWLHYTDTELTALAKTELSQSLRHSNDLDNPHMPFIYKNIDTQFNGKEALSWFPHLEYYLNLAASGKQTPEANLSAEDWEKYSRIIGVTWSGSVTPSNVFLRAEMYANEAGRELAKVLKQLMGANIQINIITHSLGARVALSALNILGDYDGEYDNKVDNLIMWEAAVADNAMTGNYTREKNPLAMELFPFAHKAVKRMRILYSQHDGVLGRSVRSEDNYGVIGGAYSMKYSTLAGNSNSLKDYYQQNLIAQEFGQIEKVKRQCRVHTGYKDSRACVNFDATLEGVRLRKEIKRLLEEEAQAVSADINLPLSYLKPWSHFRRFEIGSDYFEHITDVLTNLVLNNWSIDYKDMAVRPALGHQGNRLTTREIWVNDKPLSKAQQKEWFDSFINDRTNKESENNPDKQFWFFDQSVTDKKGNKRYYFISHSAMREFEFKIFDKREPKVFPDVYRVSYLQYIMDAWIKDNSHFGRYEK
ncbi:alpha/beta hydrolase, partial [Glaesserella sp.]|uniref:alpha/beta hydrolase n=1 Tax=Glaesserella sp. TaxID=2094731 RepID=UPI0035A08D68